MWYVITKLDPITSDFLYFVGPEEDQWTSQIDQATRWFDIEMAFGVSFDSEGEFLTEVEVEE